jgi:hypothetical protein
MSNSREKKERAVVCELKKQEMEERYLHLVQCNQQGQCVINKVTRGGRQNRLERYVGIGTGEDCLYYQVNLRSITITV